MANTVYLEPSEYAEFGVKSTTPNSVILRASRIIDGFLDRKDGLLYEVDLDGNPVYMKKTGLPIRETYEVPRSQHITLSYTPVVKVLSIKDNKKFAYNAYAPGIKPSFTEVTNFYYEEGYSDLWLAGAYPGSQATVSYIGGWTYENLPSEIKLAAATIANLISGGIISGNVRKFQAGKTAITFGMPTTGVETLFVDEDVARMLMPYKRTFR